MSGAIRFKLSVDGLARTRLAHSPLWEALFSLRALSGSGADPVHEPWARAALSRLDGIDRDTLFALWTPCAAIPDFLTPPPLSSRPQLADELARVRATPGKQIRRDLALTYGEALPRELELLHRRPGAGVDRLVRLLHAYWERALADHWTRLRLVLESDVVFRTRALAASGSIAVFADLHDRVAWDAGDVVVGKPGNAPERCVDVNDVGLLLIPSAFVSPLVATMLQPLSPPVIVYPSRGIGLLWRAAEPSGPEALAALIGRTRAGLLAMLDGPLSTSEIAQRCAISIGGVSRHLTVLRDAGLVSSHRMGHAIVHQPTPLGLSLLEADGETPIAAAG